jgi:hypothetical protein
MLCCRTTADELGVCGTDTLPAAPHLVDVREGHVVGNNVPVGGLALLAKERSDAAEDANVALELLNRVVKLAAG